MENLKKEELKYSYLSLINEVEGTKEKLKKELIETLGREDFEESIRYLEMVKKISKIENILKGTGVKKSEDIKEDINEEIKVGNSYNEESTVENEKPAIDIGIPVGLDGDFANTKPIGYTLLETFEKTSNWRDLYRSICQKFYNLNPDIITGFHKKKNLNGVKSLYFSKNPKKLRIPYYVGDMGDKENGIYIDVYKSAKEITNLIKKIAKEYNIDETQIIIYVDENFERKSSKQKIG
jgi:hypothetical protein